MSVRIRCVVGCLLAQGIGALFAPAQSGGISFERNHIQLPDEGLRMMILRGAKPDALRPPTTYHYRTAQGESFEMYTPRDLWFPSQYRGLWEDGAGNIMTFGALREVMPSGFSGEHVTREDYQQAAVEQKHRAVRGDESIRHWLEDFAGAKIEGNPQRLGDTVRLQNVFVIPFAGTPPRIGYLFSVRPNVHGIDPEQRFFALFELGGRANPAQARRDIERTFIPSIEIIPQGEVAQATASARMQDAAAAERVARTPAYEASRQAVIHSIRGMDRWWFVETENYLLASDLSGGHRSFVRRVQNDLEALRAIYAELIPPRKAIEAVSVVRIFGDGEEYVRYVGEENRNTGGIWMPMKKELVIRPSGTSDTRELRDQLLSTIYHEALHQYLFYALDGIRTSAWINEGHATYFEGAQITQRGLSISEVETYRRRLDAMIREKRVDLKRLLSLSYDDFYERTTGVDARRRDNYALSWALIYYLRRGAATNPDNAFEAIPERYTDALWQLRDPERATATVIPSSEVPGLTADFLDFWTSPSRQNAARRSREY